MILATKLFIPPPSSSLVARDRLLARLEAGLARPLTLVSAPAGFGKSTLLSVWAGEILRTTDFRVGWLSLDAQDNAPGGFWSYLAAAWQSALPAGLRPGEDAMQQLHALLKGDERRLSEEIVGAMISLLLSVPVRVVVILDDYHHIHNPDLHTNLGRLVERLPGHIRLAIATRFDPPLPIPRLRVREQLTELRASDLRFTGAEIGALFAGLPGLAFTREDLAALETSTEGWAAGVKMAALALQAQSGPTGEARTLSAVLTGQNTYILDYLAEEVLAHLPEATQAFLIKTSFLERFNAGLCAAVAFDDPEPGAAAVLLDKLERANLFLIPLDAQRQWFRYHHLFADLLRARLQQRYAGQLPALHHKAAAWLERTGWIEEAVQQAAAAQDWEHVAGLMEAHVNAFLDRGQLAVVLQWVDALPAGVLRRRPDLCIQVAWAMAHAGKTDKIRPILAEATAALDDWERIKSGERLEPPLKMDADGAVRTRASLAIFQAYGLILAAQPERALQLAQSALVEPGRLGEREAAWLTWICGYAYRGMGDVAAAARSFGEAIEIARAGGTVWEDLATDLGITYRLSGQLERAAQVFEESLRLGEQSGLRNKGNLSRVEAYLSAVRMEQNRMPEGLEHARRAVDYLQWWPSHNHTATAYGFYALALLVTGDLQTAAEAVERAGREQSKGEVTPFVVRLIESARVRLWLANEDQSELRAWVEAQPLDFLALPAGSVYTEYEEMRGVTLVRAWLGLGRWENDIHWLTRAAQALPGMAASAEQTRRTHAWLEITLLAALVDWELAMRRQAAPETAFRWLERSLSAGLPAGFRRLYLNEGRPLEALLRAWIQKDPGGSGASGAQSGLVLELLASLAKENGAVSRPRADGLVEPLTEREQEVLLLVAQGLSNRDMAARLFVTEGTIKTHVHHLIGKLGVESRTQALARARELGLLKH